MRSIRHYCDILNEAGVAVSRRLYHATPAENIQRIDREGLQLNAGDYPTPRIYLMQDTTDAIQVAGEIAARGIAMIAILAIDVDRMPRDAEFYPDPQWHGDNEHFEHPAVYTETAIPPEAVLGVVDAYDADELL